MMRLHWSNTVATISIKHLGNNYTLTHVELYFLSPSKLGTCHQFHGKAPDIHGPLHPRAGSGEELHGAGGGKRSHLGWNLAKPPGLGVLCFQSSKTTTNNQCWGLLKP